MKVERSSSSWLPLIAIALTMMMVYITSFSINVLIGAIVKDLGTTVATLQMVIVAASLIGGALMVTAGRLGDKVGKKKVFVLGILIYIAGLTLVVLSPNETVFAIAWALIWPSGMVLIIPTTVSMIMEFYDGSQRAVAFGVNGAVLSAVSALAPIVVGYFASTIGWRPALALSPVVGIVALLVALRLPESRKDPTVEIDLPSVLLSFLGFGLFLVSTTLASQYGWFWEKRPLELGGESISLGGLSIVPILYVVSFLLLYLFVRRGQKLKVQGGSPLMDIAILKNSTFAVGMTVMALFFLVNAGLLFVISVYLQAGVRFDPFQTALTTLPYTALIALLSLSTPKLGRVVAPKWIISIGLIVLGVGAYLAGVNAVAGMKPTDLLVPMIFMGIGGGLIMAQISTVTMSTVAPADSGAASGLSETLKEILGQGFAIALAGSILFGSVYTFMADSYAELEGVELSEEARQDIVLELEDTFQSITELEEQEWVEDLPDKTRSAYSEIVDSSAKRALEKALLAMNFFLALSLVLTLFLPAEKLE